MNESETLSELLCGFFAEAAEIPFVPEVWREGAASVRLTGAAYSVRDYVDGSGVTEVPFEIRVRCDGAAIRSRLDALALFASLADYARAHVPAEGVRVKPTSGGAKSAVYDDGTEEYRMSMSAELFRESAPSGESD